MDLERLQRCQSLPSKHLWLLKMHLWVIKEFYCFKIVCHLMSSNNYFVTCTPNKHSAESEALWDKEEAGWVLSKQAEHYPGTSKSNLHSSQWGSPFRFSLYFYENHNKSYSNHQNELEPIVKSPVTDSKHVLSTRQALSLCQQNWRAASHLLVILIKPPHK